MLVDTHCHIHFNAYKDDMDAVIRRAQEAGVAMITIGTQKDTSAKGLEVCELYDNLFASVGLHPNHLCEQEFYDEDELPPEQQATPKIKTRSEAFDHNYYLSLAKHTKCVAIGECGFDYYRIPPNVSREEVIAVQDKTVREHFDLATEVGKPVIIHCRDAHADQIKVIEEYVNAGKLARRGVVHCFTGTQQEAEAYIKLGFKIAFGGILTFPPRKTEGEISPLQQVAKALPLEHLVIETDAPYLTPLPYRGKRNEPAYVEHVARKIAELKGISYEEVAEVTTKNAKELFGLTLV